MILDFLEGFACGPQEVRWRVLVEGVGRVEVATCAGPCECEEKFFLVVEGSGCPFVVPRCGVVVFAFEGGREGVNEGGAPEAFASDG